MIVIDMQDQRELLALENQGAEQFFGEPMLDISDLMRQQDGQGVINIKTTARNGLVVGLALCQDGDDVVLMTTSGMIVRSPVGDLRPMGRNTAGVRIINLKEDDALVGAEIVDASDLELVDGGEKPA